MAVRHVSRPNLAAIRMLEDIAGHLKENPGTEYVELASYNIRAGVDFRDPQGINPVASRVVITAEGNEIGWKAIGVEHVGKSDAGKTVMVCEREWSGTGVNRTLRGDWTPWPDPNLLQDATLAIVAKGASATEDITIYAVDLELLYYG